MKDLEIVNLYERTNKTQTNKFMEKIESNLRVQTQVKKTIKDIEWIEKFNETIPYLDNILRAPNRFIINEEEIVKIEIKKKITVDSIKHLSRNTNLIQSIDKKTGDVRPSKILNINKEESYDTYENKLIYTLIQNMKLFVQMRKESLEKELDNKNVDNKNLNYNGTSKTAEEKVDLEFSLNSTIDYDNKNNQDDTKDILEKITNVEHKITDLTSSEVYKIIDKKHITLIREPIKKTNVILKNVNFQYAMKLWNYLRDNFDDKTIHIDERQDYEDNGDLKQLIDETFMLQYVALKTLDEDKLENEEVQEEIKEAMLQQMVEKMLDMDEDLTDNKLKEMVAKVFEKVKYKKMDVLKELQKIYREHIDNYLEKVSQ